MLSLVLSLLGAGVTVTIDDFTFSSLQDSGSGAYLLTRRAIRMDFESFVKVFFSFSSKRLASWRKVILMSALPLTHKPNDAPAGEAQLQAAGRQLSPTVRLQACQAACG